jgi:outer membrane protein assembly factor BamE
MRPQFSLPRSFHALSAACICALVAACSFAPIISRVDPYRIDIRQGNYVDQAMVAKLKRGMTRDQVRFVLGSPLVSDVFRNDRWDYVYRFQSGKGAVEQRVLAVFFVDDQLDRLDGDIVAGDAATAASAQEQAAVRMIEVPPVPKK